MSNLINAINKTLERSSFYRDFYKLEKIVSIDDIYERGEYFRKGLDFDSFIENWKRIRKEVPHVRLSTNVTVNMMNIHYLDKIIEFIFSELCVEIENLNFNILREPEEYCISVLPNKDKENIIVKLEKYQNDLPQRKFQGLTLVEKAHILKKKATERNHKKFLSYYSLPNALKLLKDTTKVHNDKINDPKYTNIFTSVISFLKGESKEQLLPKFFERTIKLDQIRKENYEKLFPELVEIKKGLK